MNILPQSTQETDCLNRVHRAKFSIKEIFLSKARKITLNKRDQFWKKAFHRSTLTTISAFRTTAEELFKISYRILQAHKKAAN